MLSCYLVQGDERRSLRVDQIDHVELFVPDRFEAAEWYERALGLTVVSKYKHWADDPQGPLMISSDNGSTKLALFDGKPQGQQPTAGHRERSGFHRVAFRVGASSFLGFLDQLPTLGVVDDKGRIVTKDRIVDHSQAFSVYFNDPFGHRLELTTYEHTAVAEALARS